MHQCLTLKTCLIILLYFQRNLHLYYFIAFIIICTVELLPKYLLFMYVMKKVFSVLNKSLIFLFSTINIIKLCVFSDSIHNKD